MSISPPMRRLSSASSNSKREENLINTYEAEEERIINMLSRKLEQLREEKITLERAHEEESESHVNRLSRELSALRMLQMQSQAHLNGNSNGVEDNRRRSTFPTPESPSAEILLEALRKENEGLRNRLVTAERDYIRVTRLNEVYREELIDHRRRLGLSVDNLIGLSSFDPYSQPLHRRSSSTTSSSPTTSMIALPSPFPRPSATHSVPIPRPASQIHRPNSRSSAIETPLSHSPSSADSPFPFSPVLSAQPESYVSTSTQLTTPPSSASLQSNPPGPYPMVPPSLSYPSVPPPSLSSSLGSPMVMYHMPHGEPARSPDAYPVGRRSSVGMRRGSFERRIAESGSLREYSSPRRESIERGGRVAETGSLIRSRAGSAAVQPGSDHSPVGISIPGGGAGRGRR